MRDDLLNDCGLRPAQVQMLLQISRRTYQKWQTQGRLPHQAELILSSVAQGLPVMPHRAGWWDGWRMVHGWLVSPAGERFCPADLWRLRFLELNMPLIRQEQARRGQRPSNLGWLNAAQANESQR